MVLRCIAVLQLAQQILLMVRQVLRHLQRHLDELVAAAAAIDRLDALSAHAEYGTRLCTCGHGVLYLAVDGGHNQLIAQAGLCIRNRDLAPYVIAVTLEQRMRTDGYSNNNIASRSAVDACTALAPQSYALAVVNACRNLHTQLAGTALLTGTTALLTRLLNDLAGTTAIRTRAGGGKGAKWGALGLLDRTGTMTVGTGSGV